MIYIKEYTRLIGVSSDISPELSSIILQKRTVKRWGFPDSWETIGVASIQDCLGKNDDEIYQQILYNIEKINKDIDAFTDLTSNCKRCLEDFL